MSNKCKCGFDTNHPKVVHESEYSTFGWFLFTVLGLSAKPKLVKFKCSVCNEIITTSNDPQLLEKYVGR